MTPTRCALYAAEACRSALNPRIRNIHAVERFGTQIIAQRRLDGARTKRARPRTRDAHPDGAFELGHHDTHHRIA